jgi:hypothetical protein
MSLESEKGYSAMEEGWREGGREWDCIYFSSWLVQPQVGFCCFNHIIFMKGPFLANEGHVHHGKSIQENIS